MEIVRAYKDDLFYAVFYNEYEEVKKIIESGNYNRNFIDNIGYIYSEIPIKLYYITQCWLICFNESKDPLYKKYFENAKKILEYFKQKLNIVIEDVPFSKYGNVCIAEQVDIDTELSKIKKVGFSPIYNECKLLKECLYEDQLADILRNPEKYKYFIEQSDVFMVLKCAANKKIYDMFEKRLRINA